MVNQLGNNNTTQRLLAGNSSAQRTARQTRSGDAFVANNNEKRYLWIARAFAVITVVSLCCNVILLLAIAQVIPLFRVEPYLLTFQSKDEQIYNIMPYNGDLSENKSITEAFVRSYVLQRNTVVNDEKEMEIRWLPGGPIQEMSSSVLYDDFVKNVAKPALELVRQKGWQRTLRILTVNEVEKGFWQVEYETSDMYPSSAKPVLRYWIATLRISYRKKSVKFNDRLNNPIGFTVTRYAVDENKTR